MSPGSAGARPLWHIPIAIYYLKPTATYHYFAIYHCNLLLFDIWNLLLPTIHFLTYCYLPCTSILLIPTILFCYLLFETYCYLPLFCYLPLQPTAIYYLKPTVTYSISINRLLPTMYVNPINIYHILENLLQPFI